MNTVIILGVVSLAIVPYLAVKSIRLLGTVSRKIDKMYDWKIIP